MRKLVLRAFSQFKHKHAASEAAGQAEEMVMFCDFSLINKTTARL